jgi:hypothetical protein
MGRSCPPRAGQQGAERIAAVVGTTTVMALSLAGQASARVIERGPIHDEFSERISNFCDVTGLTVRQDVTFNGRYVMRFRGRDRLPT